MVVVEKDVRYEDRHSQLNYVAFVAELTQRKISLYKSMALPAATLMLMMNSGLQKGMNRSCVAEGMAELLKSSITVNPSEHSQIL